MKSVNETVKNEKSARAVKIISTILVELVLFFVLVYTNPFALRAPIIIIAFIFTIARRVFRKQIKKMYFLHIFWAFAFLALVLLSKFWALYPQGIDDVRNNVLWSVMTTVIVADYIIYYKLKIKDVVKLITPIALLFIFDTLLFGVRDGHDRLNLSNNANQFGMIAMFLASFFLYLVFSGKKRRLFNIIIAGILVIAGLLSGSRKAIISLFVYLICYYLFSKLNENIMKKIMKLITLFGVLLLIFLLIMNVDVFYNTIGNRLESLLGFMFGQESADVSVNTRMNMVDLASSIISSNPILGIGANNFKYFTYYDTYSHSGYMEIMCSFGLVGMIVYYLPVFKMMLSSFKIWREKYEDAIFPVTMFLVFFICEIAGVSYFSMYSFCYIGVAAGLSYVIIQERKEKKQSDKCIS